MSPGPGEVSHLLKGLAGEPSFRRGPGRGPGEAFKGGEVLPEESLTRPEPGFRCGPRAVLILTEPDFRFFRKFLPFREGRRLFLSEIRYGSEGALAGPALGAPQAVMLLENLAAAGVEEVLVYGWCGSLREDLPPGEILLPEKALSLEGTSRHYLPRRRVFRPASGLLRGLKRALEVKGVSFRVGALVSTDAPYREDREFLRRFSARAVAVDMETAALFAAAEALGLRLAALHLVSDRLRPEGRETLAPSPRATMRKLLFPLFRAFLSSSGAAGFNRI
ncbi:hypothetical protein [Thermosulfurimonas sp. F29]|uniref:phosphorylase family protein n=1 Tax=Thermosulfurimonas sp. F29 TaxID=2867247 RepID=UPI001C82EF98|nr:hypothetical protein [Thermosulfurimonas sp. F29]MBX6422866.1 hypothetical protein [Thermosulfurimonas sp. F29]